MIKTFSTLTLTLTLTLALAAVLLPATSHAIGKAALKQVLERYRLERDACLDGRSQQSLQTCLREADAARVQAIQSDLDDGATDYVRNASRRCDSLPPDLRQPCVARMQGAGTVSGSAAGGGIDRELVTTQPPQADKPPVDR